MQTALLYCPNRDRTVSDLVDPVVEQMCKSVLGQLDRVLVVSRRGVIFDSIHLLIWTT